MLCFGARWSFSCPRWRSFFTPSEDQLEQRVIFHAYSYCRLQPNDSVEVFFSLFTAAYFYIRDSRSNVLTLYSRATRLVAHRADRPLYALYAAFHEMPIWWTAKGARNTPIAGCVATESTFVEHPRTFMKWGHEENLHYENITSVVQSHLLLPIVRLPRTLKSLAGETVTIYQTEKDGSQAFFVVPQLDNLDKFIEGIGQEDQEPYNPLIDQKKPKTDGLGRIRT
jgi:hypothetical protein